MEKKPRNGTTRLFNTLRIKELFMPFIKNMDMALDLWLNLRSPALNDALEIA
jgi:hypothetical protein